MLCVIHFVIGRVPPSLNSAYKKFKNRIVLSKDSKDFKQLLADNVSDNFRQLQGHINLKVEFMFADNRKRDIDNYLKVLIDAMNNILLKTKIRYIN